MRESYRRLLKSIIDNNPRLFSATLSLDPKLRHALQQRYGSTTFKNVKYNIKYRYMEETYIKKKSVHRSLMKNLSFKSLMNWLKTLHQQGKDYSKLLKHLASRYRGSVPDGLRKDEYILYRCGIEKIDKCECGKYKLASKDKCRICITLEKCKDTIKKKYGVDNISQHPDIKKKKVEKWKQNADKWVEKQRQTMLKKYGYANASQIPEIRQLKSEKLKQLRLDFDRFVQLMNQNFKSIGRFNQRWEIPDDIYERIKDSENPYMDYLRVIYYEKFKVDDRCDLLTTFEEFSKSTVPKIVKVRCKECGRISTFSIWGIKEDIYLSCKYCNAYTSVAERQLFNWLKQLGFNPLLHYNRGTREGELDIYIPEINLAIEYQGLVWHTGDQAFKRDCEKWYTYTQQGVRLFYIYEDDYNKKHKIVKSMLFHKLGSKQHQQVIYARKCNVSILHKADKKLQDFFNANHIHGFVPGQYYGILTFNNQIVATMILSKHRFSKQDDTYEITRFCTKVGHHIPGAFSKLYKHMYQMLKPKRVIFYIDSTFGSNLKDDIVNRYKYLDIQDIQLLEPSYYVVDLENPFEKHHRLYASKESLSRFTDIDLSDVSQEEALQLAGFGKVFRPPSWKVVLK